MSDEADRDGTEPGRSLVLSKAEPPTFEGLLRAAPGLARIAATAGLRGARSVARSLLGVSGASSRPGSGPMRHTAEDSTEALRRRGEELLRQSADIRVDADSHPAYLRILDALAPDEARILRFLAQGGPQPSVDVRSGLPLFASELVTQGRTMIGEEAGCRHSDRIYAYLNNLHRLGLIWFSRETIREAERYQVLEAQPDVVEALEGGGRTARTVRRSIVLTPFGEDFCAICLPLETPDLKPGAPSGGST
jgi:hypothetical protein